MNEMVTPLSSPASKRHRPTKAAVDTGLRVSNFCRAASVYHAKPEASSIEREPPIHERAS